MGIKKRVKKMMLSYLAFSLVGSMFVGLPNAVSAAPSATEIKLSPHKMKKVWDGWGTSLIWFANATGGWENEQAKNDLVDALYGKEGLNYNIARYNIGGGDDPTHNHMREGADIQGFSTEEGHFDINRDEKQRWWLQEALKRKPELIMEAFSNSAPYYMTHSGCTAGNHNAWENNLKEDYYDDFAAYLAEVVKHYKDDFGIEFDTLSPINEPNTNYWGAFNRQEGSHWDPWAQSWIIWEARQKLNEKGLNNVGVSAMEESVIDTFLENWSHYNDDAKNSISQMNVHAYGGSKRYEVRQLAEKENKKLWMSEVDLGPSGIAHNHDDIEPALALADQIMVDIKWFEPQAWVIWQAIESEQNMQPDKENMNWGLIHADFDTEQWWYTKKYYAMAQFSKFIPQGSKFFENSDGDGKTLTAYNEGTGETVIVYRNPDQVSRQLSFDLSKFAKPGSEVSTYVTTSEKDLQEGKLEVLGTKLYANVEGKSITTFVIKNTQYVEGQEADVTQILNDLKVSIEQHKATLNEDNPDIEELEALITKADDALQSGSNEQISDAIVEISLKFKAMLSDGVIGVIPQQLMRASASSAQSGEGPELTIDGDVNTKWHTPWGDGYQEPPHSITYELGKLYKGINKLEYTPRQDTDTNGTVTKFEIEASIDGVNFNKIAEGTWDANKAIKTATFTPVDATHVKFKALASQSDVGTQFASAAEINLYRDSNFKLNSEQLAKAITDAEQFIATSNKDENLLELLKQYVDAGNALMKSDSSTQEEMNRTTNQINDEMVNLQRDSFLVEGITVKYAPEAHWSTPVESMLDGNRDTFYETNWEDWGRKYQAGDYIVLDLNKSRKDISQILYTPRQGKDKENGRIRQFKIYTSDKDLSNVELTGTQSELDQHFELAAVGGLDTGKDYDQFATFTSKNARYVAIQVIKTGGNSSTLSIGDLAVYQKYVADIDTSIVQIAKEKLVTLYEDMVPYVRNIMDNYLNELEDTEHLTLESLEHYNYWLNEYYNFYSNLGHVSSIKNGEVWLDTDGVPIQAHGGGIIYDEKTKKYYWYGEDKTESNMGAGYVPMTGVHAYSSTDLYNWKNEGVVLPVFNNPSLGDRTYDGLTDASNIPMYIHEDDELYKESGVGFESWRQEQNYGKLDDWNFIPENGVEKRFYNFAGNMKSPVQTLKKHNTREQIADLNALYKDTSIEEKQRLYGLFNWDKVVERPKVVYNEKYDNYVMWWHHDGPMSGKYWTASGGVAVSKSPIGPFKVLDIERMPNDGWDPDKRGEGDGMLRDMTLYVDDDKDKTAYLVYSSEGNGTTIVLKLDDTYTQPAREEHGNAIWAKAHSNGREAPTLFKQDDTYYSITSGLTGWNPNPAKYHITGHPLTWWWEDKGDPFWDDYKGTTHESQSTFVLPYRDKNGNIVRDKFIFMADRWNHGNLSDSRYIWSPLHLDTENKRISMNWQSEWDYSQFGEAQIEKYTVTFNSNGGSSVASIEVKPDSPIAEPAAPNKEGYIFIGWYKDEALKEQWNFATDRVAEQDITLYAKWESESTNVLVESISLTSASGKAAIEVKGGSLKLTAELLPTNASNKKVAWTVYESDGVTTTDKASIDQNGLLTAVKDGAVKVFATATDGSEVRGEKAINITNQTSDGGNNGGSGGGITEPALENPALYEPKKSELTIDSALNSLTASLDRNQIAKKAAEFLKAEQAGTILTIDVPGNHTRYEVRIPLDALSGLAANKPDSIVSIRSKFGSYEWPVSMLNSNDMKGKVDADAVLIVSMVKANEDKLQQLDAALSGNGVKRISDIIDYKATLKTKDAEYDNHSIGSIERTLTVDKVIRNFNEATVVSYDPETGAIRFVPAVFTVMDGKTVATIKHYSNGMYVIIEGSKTFEDMRGHWAQKDVETLASKLIVNGKTNQVYDPEGKVTRAEFASLLVRSLGLNNNGAAQVFDDVAAAKWYAADVSTAVQHGLVQGVGNNKFNPEAFITREQMAVMIMKAVQLIQGNTSAGSNSSSTSLAAFADQDQLSGFAREAVQAVINAGIMNGKSETTIAPKDTASRAQTAVMLKRVLSFVKLINS
ncbi:S-layer homology domain-containing protein [Paenibacillus sp. NRS-1760]|uniref:S-layer homology domain-containing protein n=1 Tax=Paenibacillus sp. NRS-1760 TaxID=3233902 RepID=UPI003D26F7AF